MTGSFFLLNVFRVGVLCRILYFLESGLITSVGEERAKLSAVVYL